MSKRPGRVTGKAAKRNSPWRKPKLWGVAALVVVLAAGGGIAYVAFDDSGSDKVVDAAPKTAAQLWQDGIVKDIAAASQGTLDYLKVIYDWNEGKADSKRVSEAADQAFGRYMEARGLLAQQTAFEPAPRALLDYRDTFELYTETTRLAKLGAGITDEKLRKQVQNQILRLRQLADRFYDLGKTEVTGPELKGGDGFEYVPTAEVPSFAGSGSAAGPPLSSPGPTPSVKREYQETRPEQDFESWVSTVRKLTVPTGAAMVDAIRKNDEKKLGSLAVAFTEAADALYGIPDPRGNRYLSTRIQLGLLVQAEAMRTGQIAALAAKDERAAATRIAETLALIGTRIWDARIGERRIELSDGLLERKPV